MAPLGLRADRAVTEYLVAPLDETEWTVAAEELAAGLRERWPQARAGHGAVEGASMGLEASIPLERLR